MPRSETDRNSAAAPASVAQVPLPAQPGHMRTLLIISVKKWALGWTVVLLGGAIVAAIFALALSPLL